MAAPWIPVSGTSYRRVEARNSSDGRFLIGVNGISVGNLDGGINWSWPFSSPLGLPKIHIVDHDALVPLTVTRSDLGRALGCEEQIHRAMARTLIAALLEMGSDLIAPPIAPGGPSRQKGAGHFRLTVAMIDDDLGPFEAFFIHSTAGFTFAWDPLVLASGLDRLVKTSNGVGISVRVPTDLPPGMGVRRGVSVQSLLTSTSFFYSLMWSLRPSGRFWTAAKPPETRRIPMSELHRDDDGSYRVGDAPAASEIARALAGQLQSDDEAFVSEQLTAQMKLGDPAKDEFSKIWLNELKLPALLPYDLIERRRICEHAFESLKPEFAWLVDYYRWEVERAQQSHTPET